MVIESVQSKICVFCLQVRYTGYRDRSHEERQVRFQAGCREGHSELVSWKRRILNQYGVDLPSIKMIYFDLAWNMTLQFGDGHPTYK